MNQYRKIKSGSVLKSVTVSKEPCGQYYAEYTLNTFIVKPVYQKAPNAIKLDMKLGLLYVDNNENSVNMPDFNRNRNKNSLVITLSC